MSEANLVSTGERQSYRSSNRKQKLVAFGAATMAGLSLMGSPPKKATAEATKQPSRSVLVAQKITKMQEKIRQTRYPAIHMNDQDELQPPAPTDCTKDTVFQPADALQIDTNSPGYKQVIDPPYYYEVYGYTPRQIQEQLNKCTPVSDGDGSKYAAQVNAWVNYRYDTYKQSGGLCALGNVAVGLHINSVYPLWDKGLSTNNRLDREWQRYMMNLKAHEDDHENIAIQYARKLFEELTHYPDTDCNRIIPEVNDYANNILSSLKTTQADYDIQTGHGARQGAIFP